MKKKATQEMKDLKYVRVMAKAKWGGAVSWCPMTEKVVPEISTHLIRRKKIIRMCFSAAELFNTYIGHSCC